MSVPTYQPGENVEVSFAVLDDDGNVIDLTGGTLTAEIWIRGVNVLDLSDGSGLDIVDVNPAQAGVGADQDPHGYTRITGAQSEDWPLGRVVSFRPTFVDSAGRVLKGPEQLLEGVR